MCGALLAADHSADGEVAGDDADVVGRAHPQLQAHGRRRDAALDVEVFAVKVEFLALPRALHDRDALLVPRHLVFRIEYEKLELRREIAQADAETEAAVGQNVDHRAVLGDVDRVFKRE
ncbi:hypothetical protein BIV23_38315 [Streptomyces monashensis]|uniref:Uncharacterized protein n=1 Tax=Streptomyces monashensis TaxID=1678012 RepID=A0A1S2PIG7_9ACTN|nr:hypothetical protein BIV23_38315 [Streptomyces monashensis]